MDFELPEELRLLKETVRTFVDRELIPIEMTSMDGVGDEARRCARALEEKAKKLGLWHLDVPTEYGGQGLNLLGMVVVWEEIARTIAMPPRGPRVFGPDLRPILFTLNAGAEGEVPASGAARREDDGVCAVRARRRLRSGRDAHHRGAPRRPLPHQRLQALDHQRRTTPTSSSLSPPPTAARAAAAACRMFLVDADTPGVKVVRKTPTMMGDEPCEIALDDVKVPVENLIGKEGDGMRAAQSWITAGRLYQACRGLGVAKRCLDLMMSYAKQRVTFGAAAWPSGRRCSS